MWFLTHIRQTAPDADSWPRRTPLGNSTLISNSCARNQYVVMVLLACTVLLTGCASAPKLFAPDERLSNREPQDIPVPVFDEMEPLPSRVASSQPMRGLVSEPEPFAWLKRALSAGKRDIEGVTIGQGGYRTVIIGSLAGDDPLAIALTEKLAEHVHENQIILGGIQVTVVRNANPDGAALLRSVNENGVSLNRQFTSESTAAADLLKQEPEVRFLQAMLNETQPQRVIHIRSISRAAGVVAASSGAANVAQDISSWLGFKFAELPGTSLEGTLERYLSQENSCEIITFAIPQTVDQSEVWDLYGDSVLNLLLDEDFETRKLAREASETTAADSRGRKQGSSLNDD